MTVLSDNAQTVENSAQKYRRNYFAGGSWSFFMLNPGGFAAFPGGTNVAHVLPDSGLYSTVLPGTGGMRIK
jgi:hypothetical protein